MKVELLIPERFEHYWPQIQEMMKRVPHTWEHLTLDSVYSRAMRSSLQVWGVGDAKQINMVLFTQIACHASKNVLEVIWAGGNGVLGPVNEVVDATLERFAWSQNCVDIDVIGREGWERYLSPYGFKKVAVIMSRPVANARTH